MTDQTMIVTKNPAGGWDVVHSGVVIMADFQTHAAAWRWIDRCDGDPVSKSEQRAEYWWHRD